MRRASHYAMAAFKEKIPYFDRYGGYAKGAVFHAKHDGKQITALPAGQLGGPALPYASP